MKKISLFLLCIICSCCQFKSQTKKKPNIIIILTDDQGYGDVGFMGNKQLKTPNLDKLAKNGVVFTNGYVSYSVCGPSRAGIITGRYQDKFGYSRNPLFAPKDDALGLPLEEETIAESFKKVGYSTMAIGKWHLGAHKKYRPLQRGFDEFFGFLSGGHKYFPDQLIRNDLSEVGSQFDAYNTKLLRNNKRIEEKEYLTDAFSREAVHFIENQKENPFFLYLAYNAPHAPLQATEKYLSRYPHIKKEKRKTYAAMVSAVDDGVGLILEKLKALNIEENTMIFFLSDNGGNENKGAYNGVLRKGKGSLHEGGIRVPFAMQWKSKVPPGMVYENPIISLDIFATIAKYAHATPKNTLDGVDLVPFLNGNKEGLPHQELYWRMFDKDFIAVRKNNLKLLKDKNGVLSLYNLENDISEKNVLNDSITLSKLKTLHLNWNSLNKNPIFDGLKQNKSYNTKHPDRFKNVEKY